MDLLSIVTPAFNEAVNLPLLYDRLVAAMARAGVAWEWVIVDDHSADATFPAVERLALRDDRVRGFRLARNSGSHAAIACGLHQARGTATVVMAADLQDPPETVTRLLERWRDGAQVVWAVRRTQPGEPGSAAFSRFYYWIMRRVVGMREMPSRGADFFLIDRVVSEAFRGLRERNVSVLALITWLGFRQEQIEYEKQERHGGTSGWTLAKKLKLAVDSVTAFSDLPIRLCSYAGVAFACVSVIVAAVGLALLPGPGAALLLLAALALGLAAVQLLALGVVGEYVWRALDEARGRPAWLIERQTGAAGALTPALYRAENQIK